MSETKFLRFFDFTGGLNTKSPVTALSLNQALDLQNINLLPSGGFEKRRGNSVFNSSAMNSGANVQGLGYFKLSSGSDFLVAISGDKIYKSDDLDGTMDDITGAVSIASGQNNIWTNSAMNDLIIFVGGAPDAPVKYSGSGNAAALGGSPPQGKFGIMANNYFFIGNTTANPSRIQWSIFGNPEDWTGTGSGSHDVQKNDGDTLVGGTLLGLDNMVLFKENSVHLLNIRTPPFPLFPLFRGTGAISPLGIVNVNGVVYFITPEPRMYATDGTNIIGFPDALDDVWDDLNKLRLKYIHGQYYKRLNQIMWFASSSSATKHDVCIVWDLNRKAWLRHPKGHNMNVSCIAQNRLLYAGGYDGKIYRQDAPSVYLDNSETSTTIDAFWRSGWYGFEKEILSKTGLYADLNFTTQSSGSFEFSYGFDFSEDRRTEIISMAAVGDVYGTGIYGTSVFGGQTDRMTLRHMGGAGKFFQFAIRNRNASQQFAFNGAVIAMIENEPKAMA